MEIDKPAGRIGAKLTADSIDDPFQYTQKLHHRGGNSRICFHLTLCANCDFLLYLLKVRGCNAFLFGRGPKKGNYFDVFFGHFRAILGDFWPIWRPQKQYDFSFPSLMHLWCRYLKEGVFQSISFPPAQNLIFGKQLAMTVGLCHLCADQNKIDSRSQLGQKDHKDKTSDQIRTRWTQIREDINKHSHKPSLLFWCWCWSNGHFHQQTVYFKCEIKFKLHHCIFSVQLYILVVLTYLE